jgi:hypothetical protein
MYGKNIKIGTLDHTYTYINGVYTRHKQQTTNSKRKTIEERMEK